MPKLADVKIGDVFCILLKGEHGTGKSIMAASFAALGSTFLFDYEDRMRSVANYYRNLKRNDILNNLEYDTFFSFNKVRKRLEAIEQNPKGIKNVIWDSLTSFTQRALSNTKEFKQDTQEKSGQRTGKTIGEFRVNSIEDYNAETAAINEFVIEHMLILKSMKINFILTAHVIKVTEPDEDVASKTHIARYLMTGGKKAGQLIPGYYDEIYHTNIGLGAQEGSPNKYTIQTRHTGRDFAKTAMNLPFQIDVTDKLLYEQLKPYIPVQEPLKPGELIIPSQAPPNPSSAQVIE